MRFVDWAKLDEWLLDLIDRLHSTWSAAGKEWSADTGIPTKDSIAKGGIVPKKAAEEHQRQKELGWDVDGNIDEWIKTKGIEEMAERRPY